MFYYEERLTTGKWSPRTTPDRPSERCPEGSVRRIRYVTEVPAYMRHLTLDQMREVFSPEGRFARTGS